MIVDTLMRDVRLAWRRAVRRPGFTTVVVLCLGLGIGATTGVFSVVHAVLLRPYAMQEDDQIRAVFGFDVNRTDPELGYWIAPLPFETLRDEGRAFSGMAGFIQSDFDVVEDGSSERITGARTMAGSFEVLGIRPIMGRTLLEEDVRTGRRTALISESLWKRRFAGSIDVLGRTLEVSGVTHEIVGVLPDAARFPNRAELWAVYNPDDYTRRERLGMGAILALGRLRPGVSEQDLESEMEFLAERLRELAPDFFGSTGFEAKPLRDTLTGDFRRPLWALFAAAVFVLAIAVANVANLLLVRLQSESWERALRTAIGASRWSLLRQGLIDNLLLAGLGALGGVLLANWGVAGLLAVSPIDDPSFDTVGISPPALSLAIGITLLVALLMATLPILEGTGCLAALRQAGPQGGEGRRARRIQTGFVVTQVAVSLALLVGAGLMARSFRNLQNVDPGFDLDPLLVARVSAPAPWSETQEGRTAFTNAIRESFQALPGVEAAGAIQILPLEDGEWGYGFSIEEYPPENANESEVAAGGIVTPGYFESMGIPVVEGRAFNDADRPDGLHVSMVNRALERKYWPGGSALGKRLKRGSYGDTVRPWTEIVGIVGDVRGKELGQEPNPMLFYPQAQIEGAYLSVMVYTVRAAVEPSSLVPLLRQAVSEVSPIATVFRASTGSDILRQGTSRARFNSLVMLVFSLVGLILAVTGIYGVTAFSVGRRTREFGLRMALGAEPREVRRLVLRGATSVAGVGLVLGTLLSLLGTRLISELFYGVPAFDVATYAVVSVVLGTVVMIAAYVPARRATRIHPTTALRGE